MWKITLALLATMLFVCVGIGHSAVTMQRVADAYDDANAITVPTIKALEQFRVSTIQAVATTNEYVAIAAHVHSLSEPSVSAFSLVGRKLRNVNVALEQTEHDLASLVWRLAQDGHEAPNLKESLIDARGEVEETVLAIIRKVAVRSASQDILELKAQLDIHERSVLTLIGALQRAEDANFMREQEVISVAISRAVFVLYVAIPGFASLFLAVGMIARRTLTVPLNELIRASDRVGTGEFVLPVQHQANDEIGVLNRAFRTMVRRLDDLVADIADGQIEIAASEKRFRDFAEVSSDWLWETDARGRIRYFSGRFTELSGIQVDDIIGRPLEVLMTIADGSKRRSKIELNSQRALRDLSCEYHDADGNLRYCRLSGRAFTSKDGTFQGYRGTATDITDEKLAVDQVRYQGLHDALTDLPNRALFTERLKQALSMRSATGVGVAVLYMDLDGFKMINDTLGHATGDAVLMEMADRLRGLTGPNDTIARLGGDEFALVQVSERLPADAEHLSEVIIDALSKPIEIDGQRLESGTSIGIAIAEGDDANDTNLLRNADIAMYRAKNDGRSQFRFFREEMNVELQRRRQIEHDLRDAIRREKLDLFYQPLCAAATQELVGFEALLRWPQDDGSMMMPDDFISVAEETGLIIPLGEWILRRACRDAKAWPGLFTAVNLSSIHFLDPNLLAHVSKVLKQSGLPPHLLELEITESVFLERTDASLFQIDALRDLGVRLVMDDFGTGYSSLSYLQRFRFDKIKLDRSFVSEVTQLTSAARIAETVIELGRSLGMTTTVEGVETAEQVATLTRLGCDQMQGYYFGRPAPKHAVLQRMRQAQHTAIAQDPAVSPGVTMARSPGSERPKSIPYSD